MGILKRTKEVMCAFCSEPRNNVLLRIGTYLLLVLAIPGLMLDVPTVTYMAVVTGIIFVICAISEYRDCFFGKKFCLRDVFTAMIPVGIADIVALITFAVSQL